jgi:hypothetical protein
MIDSRMTKWLLKQIDDDLLWATEASRRGGAPSPDMVELPVVTGAHWQWESPEDDSVITPNPGRSQFVGGPDEFRVSLRSRETWPTRNGTGPLPQFAVPNAEEVPSAVGGHIIRHDPASVIRTAKAHKVIVLRCIKQDRYGSPAMSVFVEEILRDLADGYAERRGYLPEWRPYDN